MAPNEGMVETTGHTSGVDSTRCNGCGSFVSTRFIRVFGDNDDRVYGCHECMTSQELFDGGSVAGN